MLTIYSFGAEFDLLWLTKIIVAYTEYAVGQHTFDEATQLYESSESVIHCHVRSLIATKKSSL